MRLKDKHLKILKHLRSDARTSFSVISRDTGIPITTIFDNYAKLTDDGIIKKHVCLVDFKKLGFGYRNFIFLKVKSKEKLIAFLSDNPSVNSVYKISSYDYMVDAVFPGVKEYYYFMEALNDFDILKLESHDFIENLRSEDFFVPMPSDEKAKR